MNYWFPPVFFISIVVILLGIAGNRTEGELHLLKLRVNDLEQQITKLQQRAP